MQNTYLGNLPGRFEGTATRLLMRGFLMWLIVIGPVAVALAAAIASFDVNMIESLAASETFTDVLANAAQDVSSSALAIGLVILALVWSVLAATLLYPVFQAMLLRWWTSGLRFGDVAVTSHLRTGEVYGAYLRFIGWSLLFSLAASFVLGLGFLAIEGALGSEASTASEVAATLAGLASYVVVALGYSTIYQVKVKFGLWRLVVNSLDLANSAALEHVTAEGAPSSPFGEGLADALNVGGI